MAGTQLFLFSLAIVYFCSCVAAANQQPSTENWVIGYGSLMNSKYYNTSDLFKPVRVKGFARSWNAPGFLAMGLGAGLVNLAYQEAVVFLGALATVDTDYFTGVAYQVTDAELAYFDARQLGSGEYVKTQLQPTDVNEMYGEAPISPAANIFIYQLNSSLKIVPGPSNVITFDWLCDFRGLIARQTYVDIVVSACIAIDTLYAGKMGATSFSREFMQTTKGWDTTFWVNDRVKSRRPWEAQTNVQGIDTVLLTYLGQPAIDAIALDSSAVNQTLLNQVAAHEVAIQGLLADDAMLKATVAGVQANVTAIQADDATLQANVAILQGNVTTLHSDVATLQSNVADLQGNVTNLAAALADTNAHLNNVTIDVAAIHVELQADEDREHAFEARMNTELASINSQIKLMKSDMAQMHKDLQALQGRVEVDENNYKGLLIMWIVSVVVIVVGTGVGFFLLYRKMGQQVESISESIPLRPSRGYSYT